MKWYASINLAGGLVLATLCAAQAVDFPQRPVRIVVPIGPGSSMDIIARVLAQKLNEAWGQPVIVDNRGRRQYRRRNRGEGRPRRLYRVVCVEFICHQPLGLPKNAV